VAEKANNNLHVLIQKPRFRPGLFLTLQSASHAGKLSAMDPVLTALVTLAVLPMGIASIHVAEKLRWYEPTRGIWLIAIAADSTFVVTCILLTFHRSESFTLSAFFKTLLQMLFVTYFLTSLAYLIHSGAWVLTRLGRQVHMDELFSRLIVFGVFAVVDLAAFLALFLIFGF
jgi:hypothetical protein